MRWVARAALLVCVVAAAGYAFQTWQTRRDVARFGPRGTRIDIGGHRLHLLCEGSGHPVVVLDAGLGDSSLVWRALQPELARQTRVCAYDRAGYGYSDPGPAPRDSARLVFELKLLLDAAGEGGPYVLVAHSFGGMNLRLFAYTHPSATAGLVLVDPSHEDQFAAFPASDTVRRQRLAATSCRNAALSGFGIPRLRGLTAADTTAVPAAHLAEATALGQGTPWFRAFCDEFRSFATTSAAQLREARRTLDVPLVVIDGNYRMAAESEAAGLSAVDAAAKEAAWHRLHRDMVAMSTRARLVVADKSTHNVHIDQPGLVLDAVTSVVDEVRADASLTSSGPLQ